MCNSCCFRLQPKRNSDCFQEINFPVPCNGNPTILWQTNSMNAAGTFIITACSDLNACDTLTISVNDTSGAKVVATLSAGATFSFTTDVLESITVTCTGASGGICHVTGSLSVNYDLF